jgi:hypothetical protein
MSWQMEGLRWFEEQFGDVFVGYCPLRVVLSFEYRQTGYTTYLIQQACEWANLKSGFPFFFVTRTFRNGERILSKFRDALLKKNIEHEAFKRSVVLSDGTVFRFITIDEMRKGGTVVGDYCEMAFDNEIWAGIYEGVDVAPRMALGHPRARQEGRESKVVSWQEISGSADLFACRHELRWLFFKE